MANIKITELPEATEVAGADIGLIVQGGITKKAPIEKMRAASVEVFQQFLLRQNTGQRFFTASKAGGTVTITSTQPFQVLGKIWLGGQVLASGSVTNGSDHSLLYNSDTKAFSLSSNFNPALPLHLVGGLHIYTNGDLAVNSIWDQGFRPTAPNPRGMVFDQLKRKWVDIYMLGQNHIVDGTSRANVNIASGSRLPKKPLIYGGDGAASYTRLSYFEARNIMASHGKFLPDLQLVASALNGSTPLIAIGSDPVTTKHAPGYRSNIGVEQSTGHLYIWTDEHSAWNTSGAWVDMDTGQGNWYGEIFRTAFAAGAWHNAGHAGPDCVVWSHSPTASSSSITARGFSDHKGS